MAGSIPERPTRRTTLRLVSCLLTLCLLAPAAFDVVFLLLFFDMARSPLAELRLAGPSGQPAPKTTEAPVRGFGTQRSSFTGTVTVR